MTEESRRGRWTATEDGRTRREVALGLRRGAGVVYETVGLVRRAVERAVRRVNSRYDAPITVVQWNVRWRRNGPRHLYLYVDVDVDGPAGVIEFHPLSTHVAVRLGKGGFTDPVAKGDAAVMAWVIEARYNIKASAKLEW